MIPVCVAFKAHLGWVNAVAVNAESETPSPVHAQRVELIDSEDIEVKEPYHVAGGWRGLERVPRPDNPAGIIQRARSQQSISARRQLESYQNLLAALDLQWSHAVVLTSRGWLGDLEHILGSHAHIHVAEGEAIRDATRNALDALEIGYVQQDEKSIMASVGEILDLNTAECDAMMKPLKPSSAKSWRKEERLISLGAWLHRET